MGFPWINILRSQDDNVSGHMANIMCAGSPKWRKTWTCFSKVDCYQCRLCVSVGFPSLVVAILYNNSFLVTKQLCVALPSVCLLCIHLEPCLGHVIYIQYLSLLCLHSLSLNSPLPPHQCRPRLWNLHNMRYSIILSAFRLVFTISVYRTTCVGTHFLLCMADPSPSGPAAFLRDQYCSLSCCCEWEWWVVACTDHLLYICLKTYCI